MDDYPAICPLDVPQAYLSSLSAALRRLDLRADPGDEALLRLGFADVGLSRDV